jgi:IS5 family transposase
MGGKQLGFSDYELTTAKKQTKREKFLSEMEAVVPWQALIALIEPHYPKTSKKGGRPPYPMATMLRIHLLQQWYSLSDPEMHQTKKGNQWYFGMKVHAGVDKDSGLIHSVVVTAANVHDLTPVAELLHGDEHVVYGDAGYQGIAKRPEMAGNGAEFRVAMRPGKRRALPHTPEGRLLDLIETAKAHIRSKVEHPFRVIKQQFGFQKTRLRGLTKNRCKLNVLAALTNLFQARRQLLASA